MQSFSKKHLQQQRFSHKVIRNLHDINECREKIDLLRQRQPKRFKPIKSSLSLKRHSLKEQMLYAHLVDFIVKNYQKIPFTLPAVCKFHQVIYSHPRGEKTSYKTVDNFFSINKKTPLYYFVSATLTRVYMRKLQVGFKSCWRTKKCDPLLLIALYILDFLNIHPFPNANGRIARLIMILLLYQNGHEILQYVDLEKLIEKSRLNYMRSLILSSLEWHRKKHDVNAWCEYFTGLILSAYRVVIKNNFAIDCKKQSKP